MKKYIAKTNVSINVVLASGANRHVSFSPLTGGSSVFYTDDPDLIQAMERHYKFGTLFRVDTTYVAETKPKPIIIAEQPAVAAPDTAPSPTPTVEEVATAPEAPESEDAATESEQPTAEETDDQAEEDSSDEVTEETDEESAESEYKTIAVSDPDSAKSYLAEHFGYSRTKIKTIKAIKEAGAAHGIVFEGI